LDADTMKHEISQAIGPFAVEITINDLDVNGA